jgi:hypothetical protein
MSEDTWKRKLLAYLHDPPSKCADLATHDQRSERALAAAGFSEDERRAFAKQADLTASSADRFPFPGSRSAGLTCAFDGVHAGFHHPLGGAAPDQPAVLNFGPGREVSGFEVIEGQLEEREQTVQPVLSSESLGALEDDDNRWRARFFAHWRLWPQFAAERDARFAFLPADTRLPDHTIWTHIAVVAALAGCADLGDHPAPASLEEWVKRLRQAPLRPAFLKFQLGPVQEFIAQARSTRDLWSGSYLLSWLMAAGLKALSAEVGPDAVIYPNLCGQPLFDLHWRDALWQKVSIGSKPAWDSLGWSDLDLLTPNLPNVFLAIVPAKRANELGHLVADTIRNEWKAICKSVWEQVNGAGLLELCPPELKKDGRAEQRFWQQTNRLVSQSWHALPWPQDLDEARSVATRLPVGDPLAGEKTLLQRFDAAVNAATRAMPKDHRDPRYYVGGEAGPKDKLNNIGLGWALLTAANGWALDAVRQTRAFDAWAAGGWQETGVAQSKDALTGREEMLFGGSQFTEGLSKLENLKDAEEWGKLFKHDDEVGAITLVKRVWHWAYLAGDIWKLKARHGQFRMPNTRTMADHRPFEDDAEEAVEQVGDEPTGGKYFALLALDGDSIGQWVSGEKTPRYRTQFAHYFDSEGKQPQGSLEYFTRESDPDGKGKLKDRFADLLQTRRLVSPSYHLQFSESLSNFALLCARPIVEAFDGRLIYAGGDDVIAMLSADCALQCARALRMAFQGDPGLKGFLSRHTKRLLAAHEAERRRNPKAAPAPRYQQLAAGECLLDAAAPGFLSTDTCKDDHGRGRPIPFLVPGPAADCSVGIAIAHFKSPLQDVVRAAQAAEKRAKKQLGRSAVAVTLLKRSGETIEWGAKWDGGLDLYQALAAALGSEQLSAKFPHRLAELLEAYTVATTPLLREMKSIQPLADFPVDDVIRQEFGHCLSRQRGAKFPEARDAATSLITNLETALTTYLKSLDAGPAKETEQRLQSLIGLCQTVAFAHRTAEDTSESQPETPNLNRSTPAERQPV